MMTELTKLCMRTNLRGKNSSKECNEKMNEKETLIRIHLKVSLAKIFLIETLFGRIAY